MSDDPDSGEDRYDLLGPDEDPDDVNLVDKVNQYNVTRTIERLEAMYDEVPVTVEEFELGADEYADVFTATQGTGYDGNTVVFVTRDGATLPEVSDDLPDAAGGDTRDRVLMVLGRGADIWALPGDGTADQYESMQETAVRRVAEQTGVRCTITGVAAVFHRKYYPETDAEGSVHTLDVYFEADYKHGAIDVDESEVVGAGWFAEPPERLTEGAERLWDGRSG